MKLRSILLSFGCLLTALAGRGGEVTSEALATAEVELKPFTLAGEFEATYSYVGEERVQRASRTTTFDENEFQTHLVLTPKASFGFVRLGVQWERYSFSLGHRSPLPNTLQSIALIAGVDLAIKDSIILRLEAQPGFYGTFTDEFSTRQLKVPFIVGGTYIYSADLQLIAGVSVDVDRKYPVLPAVGVRWKFAPKLVLDAVLPTPRLEYELNKSLTLYAGAELKEETYRVGGEFGKYHDNDRSLNHALLTYSEIRVGGGFTYKLSEGLTLSAEGGAQPYREFDFSRADARYRSDGTSAYGQASCSSRSRLRLSPPL